MRYQIQSVFVAWMLLCPAIQYASAAGTLQWHGADVVRSEVPASTGLEGVYVTPGMDGLSLSYLPEGSASGVRWYRYSSLGGGYAEPVAVNVSPQGTVTLDAPEGDMGYLIEDGSERLAFYLIDYSAHPLSCSSIAPADEQDCGRIALTVEGRGDELAYYSINGRRLILSRDISLSYTTLRWDDASCTFVSSPAQEILEYLPDVIHAEAPLCATSFHLTGDRFLEAWGRPISVSSTEIAPVAVTARTEAVQSVRDNDNEISTGQDGTFGGSAPCVMEFKAEVTDAAVFHEWQISDHADFEDISMRVADLSFSHTFDEEGTRYVRFYCANADASCDYVSDTYTISIGASSLRCPNAFSPCNQDGVNDQWKVSYSSIISFECHIFNRNGREIASFTDPSDGWDGRYNGKFVPAGVYYYVIKATGADGHKYNLSGDINIIDYK